METGSERLRGDGERRLSWKIREGEKNLRPRFGKCVAEHKSFSRRHNKGKDLRAAQAAAYAAVEKIHFDGAHFRRDIAAKALH
jgi:allantoicase